jgi:hypothetical protein
MFCTAASSSQRVRISVLLLFSYAHEKIDGILISRLHSFSTVEQTT